MQWLVCRTSDLKVGCSRPGMYIKVYYMMAGCSFDEDSFKHIWVAIKQMAKIIFSHLLDMILKIWVFTTFLVLVKMLIAFEECNPNLVLVALCLACR